MAFAEEPSQLREERETTQLWHPPRSRSLVPPGQHTGIDAKAVILPLPAPKLQGQRCATDAQCATDASLPATQDLFNTSFFPSQGVFRQRDNHLPKKQEKGQDFEFPLFKFPGRLLPTVLPASTTCSGLGNTDR